MDMIKPSVRCSKDGVCGDFVTVSSTSDIVGMFVPALLKLKFMLGHTNHAVGRCCIADIPGCDNELSEPNTVHLKLGGM